MKRICIPLALALLLLSACAKETEPAAAPQAGPTVPTVSAEAAEPVAGAMSEETVVPETEETEAPGTSAAMGLEEETEPEQPEGLEAALSCVGQEVQALYDQIGQPEDARYEYSCSGPGDDGVLSYDGFLVFTYKEDGVETVIDAEAE